MRRGRVAAEQRDEGFPAGAAAKVQAAREYLTRAPGVASLVVDPAQAASVASAARRSIAARS